MIDSGEQPSSGTDGTSVLDCVREIVLAKRELDSDEPDQVRAASESMRSHLARSIVLIGQDQPSPDWRPDTVARLLSSVLTLAAEVGQYRHEISPSRSHSAAILKLTSALRSDVVDTASTLLSSQVFADIQDSMIEDVLPLLAQMDPRSSPRRFMPFRVNLLAVVYDRLFQLIHQATSPFLLRSADRSGLLDELMSLKYLRFGTSGVRGRWMVDLTPVRILHIAEAICDFLGATNVPQHILAEDLRGKTIVVGYDSRLNADLIAGLISSVCIERGFRVDLAERDTPTPALVYWLTEHVDPVDAAGLVNCTASHNPPEWQGVKFNPRLGYPAPTNITDFIASRINDIALLSASHAREAPNNLRAVRFDAQEDYVGWLLQSGNGNTRIKLHENRIKDFVGSRHVIVDEMHGAGRGYLTSALDGLGVATTVIHGTRDPQLGGLEYANPEEPFLAPLRRAVLEEGALVGLAMDTDADRFGVMDEHGEYFRPNQILPMLIWYLGVERQEAGRIVATQTGSPLIARIASRMDQNKKFWPAHDVAPAYLQHPFYRTSIGSSDFFRTEAAYVVPVGIKYIEEMRRSDDRYKPLETLVDDWRDTILIGGEESSGLTTRGHVVDKDGVWANLLILDMIAFFSQERGLAGLSQIWDFLTSRDGLWRSYGGLEQTERSNTGRMDVDAPQQVKDAVLSELLDQTDPRQVNRMLALPHDMTPVYLGGTTYDIVELAFKEKNSVQHFLRWRSSGTEPILRVYVESADRNVARTLMAAGVSFIDSQSARFLSSRRSAETFASALTMTTRREMAMSQVRKSVAQNGPDWESSVRRFLTAMRFGLERRNQSLTDSWLSALS